MLKICSNQYFSHISSIDKFVGRQEFIKYVDGENKRKGFFRHYVINILLRNTQFLRSECKAFLLVWLISNITETLKWLLRNTFYYVFLRCHMLSTALYGQYKIIIQILSFCLYTDPYCQCDVQKHGPSYYSIWNSSQRT